MIVWQFPKKARIELSADGWLVYLKKKVFRFNSLGESLCYLAGRGLIEYEQIDYLIQATRERAGKV